MRYRETVWPDRRATGAAPMHYDMRQTPKRHLFFGRTTGTLTARFYAGGGAESIDDRGTTDDRSYEGPQRVTLRGAIQPEEGNPKMAADLQTQAYETDAVLYMALELSNEKWRLAFGDGRRQRGGIPVGWRPCRQRGVITRIAVFMYSIAG